MLFFLPILVVVSVALLLDGGGVLFRQARIGRDGLPFTCLKFRTMVPDAQARLQTLLAEDPVARAEWEEAQKLSHDPRVTRFGEFLRRSSVDELPQLFNVLRGDMSMVGPRPIVADEIRRYGRHFRHYCLVRPGLTGLWQIAGRNCVSYGERIALDCLYVRSRCPTLYLTVLLKTVPAVLSRRGAS